MLFYGWLNKTYITKLMYYGITTHIFGAHPLIENMAKKNLRSFFHFGTFDHSDLQSYNNYKIIFFILQLRIKMSWGVWYIIGNVFSKPFQQYITSSKIPKSQLVNQRKQICSCLATAKHDAFYCNFCLCGQRREAQPCQKKKQWKNDCS